MILKNKMYKNKFNKKYHIFFFFQGTKTYLEKQMHECESQFKEKLTVGGGSGGKKSRS